MRRKLRTLDLEPLRATLMPLAIAAVVAGVLAFGMNRWWDQSVGHVGLFRKLGAVFIPGGMASAGYWLVAFGMKVPAAREITGLVFRRFGGVTAE